MEFWWGLMVGVFAGANIGIAVAGLLAGSKRRKINQDYLWDQLHMDQAVNRASMTNSTVTSKS